MLWCPAAGSYSLGWLLRESASASAITARYRASICRRDTVPSLAGLTRCKRRRGSLDFASLSALCATVRSLLAEPDQVIIRPTGQTYADVWRSLDLAGKRAFLLDHGPKVRIRAGSLGRGAVLFGLELGQLPRCDQRQRLIQSSSRCSHCGFPAPCRTPAPG